MAPPPQSAEHLAADGLPAEPSGPATPPKPLRGRSRRRAAAPATDELARARTKRREMEATVEQLVAERMAAIESNEFYSVARLYVEITGSLPTAAALQLIENWSEQAFNSTGSPWVFQPAQKWAFHSGLSEEDWVTARATLRACGLIVERRRYDLQLGELVVEIASDAEAVARAVADFRAVVRDDAWDLVRNGGKP